MGIHMRLSTTISTLTLTCLVVAAGNAQEIKPRDNLFGTKQENQVEVFVAADVPKKVEKGVKETLAVAEGGLLTPLAVQRKVSYI